jgi:hypothetical protein
LSRGVGIGKWADKSVIAVEGGPTASREEQMADAAMAGEDGTEVVDFVLQTSPWLPRTALAR